MKQGMSLSKDFKVSSFEFRREESSNRNCKLLKSLSFMISVLCSKDMSKLFHYFQNFHRLCIPFYCVVIGC